MTHRGDEIHERADVASHARDDDATARSTAHRDEKRERGRDEGARARDARDARDRTIGRSDRSIGTRDFRVGSRGRGAVRPVRVERWTGVNSEDTLFVVVLDAVERDVRAVWIARRENETPSRSGECPSRIGCRSSVCATDRSRGGRVDAMHVVKNVICRCGDEREDVLWVVGVVGRRYVFERRRQGGRRRRREETGERTRDERER